MKNKNNARTGGAVVTTPNKRVEFINTGHAAQSVYLAALANPFASPAVPIPDSFLPAHVSKVGLEKVFSEITNVDELALKFFKVGNEVTGDYGIEIASRRGNTWTTDKLVTCETGARLVAAGISFEDIGRADELQGMVTYTQENGASGGPIGGPSAYETVSLSERSARNEGFGCTLYELQRRQALEFQGNSQTRLSILFSNRVNIVARFSAIVEFDGEIGFTEHKISNKNFVITSSMPNYHAGIFADTPHPDLDHSLLLPSHTEVTHHNAGHHSSALTAAAHWVSSSAGWLWKHRDAAAKIISKAPEYYKAMTRFGGSITSASGQIMSLGARAAPLAIAL